MRVGVIIEYGFAVHGDGGAGSFELEERSIDFPRPA